MKQTAAGWWWPQGCPSESNHNLCVGSIAPIGRAMCTNTGGVSDPVMTQSPLNAVIAWGCILSGTMSAKPPSPRQQAMGSWLTWQQGSCTWNCSPSEDKQHYSSCPLGLLLPALARSTRGRLFKARSFNRSEVVRDRGGMVEVSWLLPGAESCCWQMCW